MKLEDIKEGNTYLFLTIPTFPIKKDYENINYAAYGTILQFYNLKTQPFQPFQQYIKMKVKYNRNGYTAEKLLGRDIILIKEKEHYIDLGGNLYITTNKYYAYQLLKNSYSSLATMPIAKAEYVYESLYTNYRIIINQLKKL